MRSLALALAAAATLAVVAAPAHAAAVTHCDEAAVNVNCYDQADDGEIYQCVVWWERIDPRDNPLCFVVL